MDSSTPSNNATLTTTETPTSSTSTTSALGFKTILVDSNNYHVKHPLTSHWTLHQKMGSVRGALPSSASSSASSSSTSSNTASISAVSSSSRSVSKSEWDKTMQESVTIGTIEDFWCIFNKMQDISTLPDNCDYFFMRQGVSPAWEDPANIGGGEYRITPTRGHISILPMVWRQLLMMAVGSQLTEHTLVNGVQFAYRAAKSRISIWIKKTKDEETLSLIKKEIQDIISASLESSTSSGTDASTTPLMFRIDFQSFRNDHYGSGGGGNHSSSNTHGGNHPLKPSYKPSITTRTTTPISRK